MSPTYAPSIATNEPSMSPLTAQLLVESNEGEYSLWRDTSFIVFLIGLVFLAATIVAFIKVVITGRQLRNRRAVARASRRHAIAGATVESTVVPEGTMDPETILRRWQQQQQLHEVELSGPRLGIGPVSANNHEPFCDVELLQSDPYTVDKSHDNALTELGNDISSPLDRGRSPDTIPQQLHLDSKLEEIYGTLRDLDRMDTNSISHQSFGSQEVLLKATDFLTRSSALQTGSIGFVGKPERSGWSQECSPANGSRLCNEGEGYVAKRSRSGWSEVTAECEKNS